MMMKKSKSLSTPSSLTSSQLHVHPLKRSAKIQPSSPVHILCDDPTSLNTFDQLFPLAKPNNVSSRGMKLFDYMGGSPGLSRLEQQYLCDEYQDKVPKAQILSCKSPLGQISTLQTFHGRENVKEVNELYLDALNISFDDHLSQSYTEKYSSVDTRKSMCTHEVPRENEYITNVEPIVMEDLMLVNGGLKNEIHP